MGGTEVVTPARAIGNIIRATLDNVTAPGTPPAGTTHVYVKSSDKGLYYKDDAGTETGPLAAGGGGVGGSGTLGFVPKFDPDGTTLADSDLEETGNKIEALTKDLKAAQFLVRSGGLQGIIKANVALTAQREWKFPNADGIVALTTAPGTSGTDIAWNASGQLLVPDTSATARGVLNTINQDIQGQKAFKSPAVFEQGLTAVLIGANCFAYKVAGTSVITNGKVLQNVTTNASIITAGTVAAARLPVAGAAASGIVDTGAQTFAGAKTFSSVTVMSGGIDSMGQGIIGGSFAIDATTIIDSSQNISVTGTINTSSAFQRSGTQVVGAQGAAVSDASGGATVDAEARTAINSLLARCRAHGLIAT